MGVVQYKLTGVGMPPQQSFLLGNTVKAVDGEGTTQASGAEIETNVSMLLPVSGDTAFKLSNIWAPGDSVQLYNMSTTQTALVYPPSGQAFDGQVTNAAFPFAPGAGGAVIRLTSTLWRYAYAGTPSPTFGVRILTTGTSIILLESDVILVMNKSVAGNTVFYLPTALGRGTVPIQILDWAGTCNDMTFYPQAGETIAGLASWGATSGGVAGSGAGLTFTPIQDLSGWFVG